MKRIGLFALAFMSAVATQFSLMAAETGTATDWLKVSNVILFEYDDNMYEEETDAQDTLKIIDSLTLGTVMDWERTFLTLRYNPSFTWWENREPDDTDLHHSLDFALDHEFSPRVSLSLKDSLRIAEIPEETSRGVFIRDNNDYMYNESSASLDVMALSRTYLNVGGRYTIIDYDEESTSIAQDRDIVAGGLTIRHLLSPRANLLADYRREVIGYDSSETADLRDSTSDFFGLGYEQVQGDFVGLFRAGYQRQEYDLDDLDTRSEPYGDLTVTYVISPRTRVSVSGAFSMLESEQGGFASQDRTIFTGNVSHDLTALVSLGLSASYRISEYEADYRVVDDGGPSEGDEEILQLAARAAYRINARNSIELNYSYSDLSSDLQNDFDRNRVGIGWRLDL